MIKDISIKNFKIHENLSLQLGGLTILSGQNGMGKSSIFQALLMLRQSYVTGTQLKGVNLKGNLVDLGSAQDVECQSSEESEIEIKITLDTEDVLDFRFSADVDGNDTYLPSRGTSPNSDGFCKTSLFTNNFQYISAFRFGPQKGYERDSEIVQYQGQISKMAGQCEYVVHYLAHYGNKTHCIPELLIGDDGDDMLNSQVERWLKTVSPNININIEPQGPDFKLNYKFSREGNLMTTPMPATNVGYGITYVLPIIVAILSAKPGALILIENPEAHIHPRAQAELMKLVMRAVKAGLQIIIETHSDHIINGALVALAMDNDFHSLVKTYYFDRDEKRHVSVPFKLDILSDGRIKNPPKGFFDQIDIDMKTLMGF